MASLLLAALKQQKIDDAIGVLDKSVASGQLTSAVLHVTQRNTSVTRCFGQETFAPRRLTNYFVCRSFCFRKKEIATPIAPPNPANIAVEGSGTVAPPGTVSSSLIP